MDYQKNNKEELKGIEYYLHGNKLKHSLGVEKEMDNRVNYVCELYRKYLIDAAIYHDIGKSGLIPNVVDNHNINGYLYLKGKVHPLTAYLVLRHTGLMEYLKGDILNVLYKDIEKSSLKDVEESGNVDMLKVEKMVDLLTICDILTSFEGSKINSKEKLKDIGLRYGEDSKKYKTVEEEIKRLNI